MAVMIGRHERRKTRQTTNRQWINFFLALQSTTFKLLRRLGFKGNLPSNRQRRRRVLGLGVARLSSENLTTTRANTSFWPFSQ
ncbi:hypothetical protein ACXIUT_15575 [Achromobacter denitrificans]